MAARLDLSPGTNARFEFPEGFNLDGRAHAQQREIEMLRSEVAEMKVRICLTAP
jgi:hypothetical protein